VRARKKREMMPAVGIGNPLLEDRTPCQVVGMTGIHRATTRTRRQRRKSTRKSTTRTLRWRMMTWSLSKTPRMQ
jgi:hypothetical protein